MRFGLQAADALLVATPPQADAFRASGIAPPSVRIRDVMEGSTTLRVAVRQRPADTPLRMLFVGRLNANKDPLTVVDGFFESRGAQVGCVGSGAAGMLKTTLESLTGTVWAGPTET